MNLLMISGDRSVLAGKQGAFHATLSELIRHWDRIDVICPRAESATEDASSIDGVFFHPSPYPLLLQPAWIVKKGRELHAKIGFGVMTVHEYPPFYNGIGASMLASQTGLPYAIEIHHIVGYPKAASCAEWIGRWMSRLYLGMDSKQAAGVRTVNGDVKNTLVRWGIPESKIEVVPSLYLDSTLLKPDPSIAKRYDIAFCARLVANKGLLNLIRAVGTIPHATLLVIGDGPEQYPAKRLVRELKLDERVTFVGWLPTATDVIQAMQSARIFVMNSRSEGGPRVALEAMACGLPVVSTCVGTMPDVIVDGENGVYTTGDPVDLAEKVQRLLKDAALRERLGAAAVRVIDRFEKRALVERYAEFLKGVGRRKGEIDGE